SSIKFSGSSVVLEPVKLGGFILKNSLILEVSASSCRAPLCCPIWCIWYPLILNVPCSRTTSNSSSWRHD
ncbi:hypothetical protein H5410_040531, partial [Solanum commersonii]